jgi:MFS family permease
MPPQRNDVSLPSWTLIGPGFAAVIGLFLLTVVFFGFDRMTPIQLDLGLSDRAFLLLVFAPYLVAAAIAFPLGLLLGGRFPTAVTVPGVVLMLVGVVLIAFAGSAGVLMVGRVLSGLGAGAAAGATTAVIRRINGRRSTAAAVAAVLGVLAAVVAPFVNQLIAGTTGFRVTYMAALPFLFVALVVNVVIGIARLMRAKGPVQPAYVPNTTRR